MRGYGDTTMLRFHNLPQHAGVASQEDEHYFIVDGDSPSRWNSQSSEGATNENNYRDPPEPEA